MPYLHLPVQSGSDRILKAMNRSHSTESYLRTIEKMRRARPDIAVSGDFIVGFPGESEADFEATLQIVDAVGYAAAYSFKYSARPGTPAASMEGQIALELMDERLQRLQQRITRHSLAFNRSKVGTETNILVERKGRRPGQMIGKSPWLQSVHVETEAAPGDDDRRGPGRRRPQQHDRGRSRAGRRLMARRDLAVPANEGGRARLELEFEQPYLLGPLFGDYDRHLITIENRLGVHIAARGNKVQIEGEPDSAARARDVLHGTLQPTRPGP